jgi:hypothetical protein
MDEARRASRLKDNWRSLHQIFEARSLLAASTMFARA